jgi:asparagine synthase (glutamine-hydrolysing)
MCGIFTLIHQPINFNSSFIKGEFEKGKGRGPEDSKLLYLGYDVTMGFHRLAINGLNNTSDQPLIFDNIVLICNGEIYNYKELFKQLNIEPYTESDCEIIIHLYKQYGIEETLILLDGVFSFVLYDMNIVDNEPCKLFIARDPLGVRPLYILRPNDNSLIKEEETFFGLASELKMLTEFYNYSHFKDMYTLDSFTPGTYSTFEKSSQILSRWKESIVNKPYFLLNPSSSISDIDLTDDYNFDHSIYRYGIQHHLCTAVQKRYLTTERPIACLLSGGLDSSLITALVCQMHKEHSDVPIETYSIGLKNSEDLHYAKIVADYLGTNHTEIIITEKQMIDAIPEVIYTIESYDTTTVRASIGNYLLGKFISQHSDAKVIFNGDGSDELCGGYLYMNKSPNALEFDNECRRLLKNISFFDVLRSDKCISSHGLEPRTPFLDRSFVNYYLSIPSSIRFSNSNSKKCEKYLLRQSFSFVNYNFNDKPLLPDEILWRRKEAFSDGVSCNGRSLFTIIQEYVNSLQLNMNFLPQCIINNPVTKEQKYYRGIFHYHYPNLEHVIPYFWMPKYVNATDPSARTLEIYTSTDKC